MYADSIARGDAFWAEQAQQLLSWHRPFTVARHGSVQAAAPPRARA